ncbi:unnamed protein product [Cylindrotheca closterium]|uniref:Uncharacterized protein n=1 Tax=Cylindrotheca closterium TaxID=2856 RepID=A0AAD2PWF2_9STRA|nr:unnamed protein product [Cylindrotheca closterium]
MESDSETFYSLPGSGRKVRVPIKVKKGKVVSPTGVQNFDFDEDCPDDERMALQPAPSYMSQEGEETVLLEGNDEMAELEARRIKREMEEDEATHFTEGLGEEIIMPEDSDDEEVNALADELGGLSDHGTKNVAGMSHDKTESSEEEKKEEDVSDFEPARTGIESDGEAPKNSSGAESAAKSEATDIPEKAEIADIPDKTDDKQFVSEVGFEEPESTVEEDERAADEAKSAIVATNAAVETADDEQVASDDVVEEAKAEKEEYDAEKADSEIVATNATEESEEQETDEAKSEESVIDPVVKTQSEGKSLACSTNTTEETQEFDDQHENAASEQETVSQSKLQEDPALLVGAPDNEEETDIEEAKKGVDPPARSRGTPQGDVDEDSSIPEGPDDELMFVPAVGSASDTDYATASDTDYNTATDYATTDYATTDYGTDTDGGTTDYATTDYATSFDYDTETTREVDDSASVNQSVTHSIANSIAADGKGPRTRKNEKERSKWSLFGCGIVEEVPSTKQEWWNFVLDSTEGALQTVGGNHWDDPWAAEDEFDDDFDSYLNHNRSNRPRRRARSASTTRVNSRQAAASRTRKYRRASSAPRTRTRKALPKQDRRKQLV